MSPPRYWANGGVGGPEGQPRHQSMFVTWGTNAAAKILFHAHRFPICATHMAGRRAPGPHCG